MSNSKMLPHHPGDDSDVDLRAVWHVLRRNRFLIAGCFIVAVTAGLLFARSRAPIYEASALIRVEDRRSSLPSLDMSGRLSTVNELGTEIEVLRSRALARAVVDSLGLQLHLRKPATASPGELFAQILVPEQVDVAHYRLRPLPGGDVDVANARTGQLLGSYALGDPFALGDAVVVLAPAAAEMGEIELEVRSLDAAVDELIAGLKVRQPSREANIIRVQYQGTDAHQVREVPNILVDRFLAQRRAVQRTELHSTVSFLHQQLDTLALQLADAERELRAFRERAGVVDLQVEGGTQVRRIADLQADRSAMVAEYSALTRMLEEVRMGTSAAGTRDASPYRRLLAFPSLIRNPTATELLRSLGRLEDERASLLSRRQPTDPDVQILTTRIHQVETELQALVTTYQQGLGNQLGSLDASLAGFQHQLAAIPAKEVEFARLSRQPKVLAEMYALLQTRLKEAEIAVAVEDASVRVVDAAVLPREPLSSKNRLIVGFAAIFGLLFGVGASFVREFRDGSVRTSQDVLAATGMPALGFVPHMPLGRTLPWHQRMLPSGARQSVPGGGSESALRHLASSAYERLHLNLVFTQGERDTKVLLVTSALPGDGKTTTATNLALSLMQQGLRVLLIDADLRRPTLHKVLQAQRSPGLTNVLAGTASLSSVLRAYHAPPHAALHYFTAGDAVPQTIPVLRSGALAALIDQLRPHYDRIILDSPPVNVVIDAAALASHVDGVLMVARAGVTPFEALIFARNQLHEANAPTLGVVLNDIDFERGASYDGAYRWYGYGKAYSESAVG